MELFAYTLVQYDRDPERIEYCTRCAVLCMATSPKALREAMEERDDDNDDEYTEEGEFLYTYVVFKTEMNKPTFVNLTLTCCGFFESQIPFHTRAEVDEDAGVAFRGNVEELVCWLDCN